METINNQLNAEEVLINADINNISKEKEVENILINNDIKYIIKRNKIESMLLDKDEAKDNITKFLSRRSARLNGENNKVYNFAA